MNICVFCSSSSHIDNTYVQATLDLGRLIGKRGDTLVYGGTKTGLMGIIADSVRKNGGKVVGVVPEMLKDRGISYDDADWLFVTKDLRERKATMAEQAEAFIAMPGGFGTLEEILEEVTLKQLGFHNKAIVFINTNDFYRNLNNQFEQIYSENFSKPEFRELYYFAANPEKALEYIDAYKPIVFPWKL